MFNVWDTHKQNNDLNVFGIKNNQAIHNMESLLRR